MDKKVKTSDCSLCNDSGFPKAIHGKEDVVI